jgi:4-amino-4-deoxy-L-arabinose transferase-like glycosyltransferase
MLVPVVAAAFAEGAEARALAWLLQLLPIAFTFRVRANHEPAVLLFFLVALWGVKRVGEGQRGGAFVAAGGLVGLMLVKGLLVLPALLCCVVWVCVRALPRGHGRRRAGRAAAALVGALAVMVLIAAVYERHYRGVTGESFVSGYLGRSLSVGATEGHGWTAGSYPYNLIFYSGRVLWFAFPWSLALVGATAVWLRTRPRDVGPSAQGLLFAVGVAVVYVALFSLSTRRAERYIFPAYFVVGAAGAVATLRCWAPMRALAAAVERLEPFAPPLLWLSLFGLHLAGGRIGLPRVQLWNP